MMKKFFQSILLLAGLFLLGYFPAKGVHSYYFSRLASDQGLSNNTIKCITQDSYGFIWIGTKNGLNRYDGEMVRVVNCDDYISGHSNHNISALYEDDRRQLWVGTDRGVFVYDHVTEVFTHFSKIAENGISITNWISAISSDSEGNIWIVSPKEGVFRWDGKKLFHYYLTPPENYLMQHPESMCVLRNGQLWIGTTGVGLFRYNPGSDRFEQLLVDREGNTLENDNIFALCEYGGSLAIAAHEGDLKKYDFKTGLFSLINAPQVHNTLLRDVKWFGGSELWVATHEGVFVVDEEKRTTTHLNEETFNPYAISDKTCSVIYQDREKGIWVGTMLGGVNYCANNVLTFDKYIPYDRNEGTLCKRIRGLAEGPDGRIWIGTEDDGMYVLNPETGQMRTVEYRRAKEEKLLNTLGYTVEGDELWYGIFKHGICNVNMRSGKLSHTEASTLGVNGASVYAIYNDSRGNTWLSTESDTYMREHSSDVFTVVESLQGSWVFNIMEDSQRYIWFSCMGTGLVRYNPVNKKFSHYTSESGNRSHLASYSVNSVFEDSRGRIWISTERGGLCRYNPETDDFISYSIADGLPDDVVYKVLEDSRGMLWFGTNKGLVEFDPNLGKVLIVYTYEDGLPGNQFNYNAAIKDRNGRLWFGGADGLISFSPEKSVYSDYIPPLFITQLSINNIEQVVGGKDSPLQKSILFTDRAVLEHNQSSIGLEFAAVHFSNRGSVKYFYRMDGIENDWIEAKDSRRVYYSQLAPGEYTFHVKAVNTVDGWQQDSLPFQVVVRSPWWWTGVAKVLYVMLLVAVTVLGIRIFLVRRHAQMFEQQKLFEIEKEKELYRNKVDFFNEIAHEVRTPLTLINGPLEDVIEMNTDNKLEKNLKIISENTKRLLDLIHQLLDFRNMDTNKFKMNYFVTDIPALVAKVVERFEPSMGKCGKTFFMESGVHFMAAVDREAVTKILSNLLANAMKYAASQIVVSISKTDDSFSVVVTSDGDKIPIHLAEKIFEPFYRMEKSASIPGTGIGLSLSRSLAELQKGHLFLDVHTSDASNRFVLTLPLQNEGGAIAPDPVKSPEDPCLSDPETISVSTPDGEYKVLLVEDSLSVRDYLADRLKESCTVETATNGVEALNVLQVQSVDLVVTDIMMPDMDGIELCRRMKQDENLQYIPVVLLTARNDLHSKIDGLEGGAEAFIEKPFSFAYFKALIFSIMDNRRKERELFAKRPFVPVSNIKMKTADQEFIDKVIATIQENITDENLNVEYLADKMCMNRSSLLRKIKSITNIPAVDLIKVVRLKQAALMLREGRYRINEVCYAVGINSPSYFSKLFHAQFGMLPKEFERQNHKQ